MTMLVLVDEQSTQQSVTNIWEEKEVRYNLNANSLKAHLPFNPLTADRDVVFQHFQKRCSFSWLKFLFLQSWSFPFHHYWMCLTRVFIFGCIVFPRPLWCSHELWLRLGIECCCWQDYRYVLLYINLHYFLRIIHFLMCINWIRWFIWRILTNRVDLSECFKGCVCVCWGGGSLLFLITILPVMGVSLVKSLADDNFVSYQLLP